MSNVAFSLEVNPPRFRRCRTIRVGSDKLRSIGQSDIFLDGNVGIEAGNVQIGG